MKMRSRSFRKRQSPAGDLWILGDHKLLVDDSTNGEDMAKLMAGAAADLVFTDPPYNVD
jgi:DNA modification methylase